MSLSEDKSSFDWNGFLNSLTMPPPNYTQQSPCGRPDEKRSPFSGEPAEGVRIFCSYALLLIIVCGVVGNSLSLHVFTASRSRSRTTTSCSYCLIALSLCDLLVVLTYCLVEWTKRGLGVVIGYPNYDPKIVDRNGVCQVFLYVAYTLRLTSVWLLVLFTFERYIGVCRPLQKRRLCTPTRAKQAIASVVGINCLLCLYKPLLSNLDQNVCGSVTDFSRTKDLSFVLDTCYALSTSAIPFIIIFALNIGIARVLLNRQKLSRSSGPDHMGVQFAAILVTVSSTFILLNLPYSIAWPMKWLENSRFAWQENANSSLDCLDSSIVQRSSSSLATVLPITRTIFQANYCANFFLYSLTGAFFRAELRRLFSCWMRGGHGLSRRAELGVSTTRRGLTARSHLNTVKYTPATTKSVEFPSS